MSLAERVAMKYADTMKYDQKWEIPGSALSDSDPFFIYTVAKAGDEFYLLHGSKKERLPKQEHEHVKNYIKGLKSLALALHD